MQGGVAQNRHAGMPDNLPPAAPLWTLADSKNFNRECVFILDPGPCVSCLICTKLLLSLCDVVIRNVGVRGNSDGA